MNLENPVSKCIRSRLKIYYLVSVTILWWLNLIFPQVDKVKHDDPQINSPLLQKPWLMSYLLLGPIKNLRVLHFMMLWLLLTNCVSQLFLLEFAYNLVNLKIEIVLRDFIMYSSNPDVLGVTNLKSLYIKIMGSD